MPTISPACIHRDGHLTCAAPHPTHSTTTAHCDSASTPALPLYTSRVSLSPPPPSAHSMLSYSLNAVASAPQPESAVLCRFPHGPPSALTDPSTFSSLTFQLHQSTDTRDPRKASHRLLTCDTADVEWTAANYGDSSYKLQPYTYAVGIAQ